MNTTSSRTRALACALLAGTFYTAFAAAPAAAQASPTFRTLDANGVDLVQGDFLTSFPEGSIGSGEAELALLRMVGATGAQGTQGKSQWDHILLNIVSSGTYVDFGSREDKFPGATARGATLTATTGGYDYRAPDGTVIAFGDPTGGNPYGGATNFCDGSGTQPSCILMPLSITSPDGKVVNLGYDYWELCIRQGDPHQLPMPDDPPPNCTYTPRLSSVSNSFGYSVLFSYASAGGSSTNSNPPSTFYQRTGAVFRNTAAGTTNLASVSYSYPSSGVTDITDTGGRVWRVTVGSSSFGIRRPGASSDTLSATLSGSVVTSATNAGVTTSYSRSVSGSTATMTVTNALSQATTIVSDLTLGRPTSVTDPLSHTTSFSYDTSGLLKRVTAPDGNYVEHTRDSRGNVVQTQAVPKSGSGLSPINTYASFDTTCSNPVTCNSPNSTTDARGNVTDYTYDSTHGGVLSVTAPAPTSGAVRPQTRYSYTLLNGEYRLTGTSQCQTGSSCTGTSDEVVTSITYDSNGNGNIVSSSVGNGASTLTATSGMTYDYLGNLLEVDGPLSGTADTVRYRYNAAREVVGIISPDPDGSGALKHRATRNSYTDGLLTKVEQGTVNSQSDTDWAAFSPLQEANTVYDSNARAIRTNVAAGGVVYAVSEASYDALGRSECVAERMNPAAFSSAPAYACTQGSLGTDRIGLTTYDAAGRVYQQVSAYGTADQATEATYAYTNDGQLASVTDAESNKTSYGYDGFDRRNAILYPNATKGSNTSNSSDVELMTFDAAGNVTAFTNRAAQTIAFTFDALDRMTLKDLPDSGAYVGDNAFRYDNLGRLTGAGSSTGSYDFTFTYDALNRLKQDSHVTFGAKNFDYDLAGRRIRMTWRDNFYVDYDYLVTGEMSAIRENGATSGVGVLATFGYDDLGSRTSLTRGNGTSTSYTPDAVSRLTTLTNSFPSDTSKTLSLGFAYNPASEIVQNVRGNDLYSWAGHGSGNTVSTVNGLNQLTAIGSATPTYDTKGNMTSDGTNSYAYASDNRMTSGKGLSVIYDALGRLIWVQNQGLLADFTGTDLADEQAITTYAIQRRFVYGPRSDEPLVWYEGSGTTDRRFLHADERGSIVAISNSSGIVTNVNTYDEYGKPGSGNVGRFQYAGQKWYGALGLYDDKARLYHASLGRFMQTDPIEFGGGMNIYAYVAGDPINLTDPLGLESDDACGGDGQPECPPIIITANLFGGGGGGGGGGSGASSGGPNSSIADDVSDIVQSAEEQVIVVTAQVDRQKRRGSNFLRQVLSYPKKLFAYALGLGRKPLPPRLLEAPCGCFEAGTLVSTPQGARPIEEIGVGDLVLSEDELTGRIAAKPVIGLVRPSNNPLFRLTFADADEQSGAFSVTGDHPWRVEGRGWVQTRNLAPSDRINTGSGRDIVVKFVEPTERRARTYNLTVADWHTFLVGQNRAVVHNQNCFTHNFKYDPRVLKRALQDPRAHNFPYSMDDKILQQPPTMRDDGSLSYRLPGFLNGKAGFYEIGLNPATGTIYHRTFRGE